jgi:hypothetical protein
VRSQIGAGTRGSKESQTHSGFLGYSGQELIRLGCMWPSGLWPDKLPLETSRFRLEGVIDEPCVPLIGLRQGSVEG